MEFTSQLLVSGVPDDYDAVFLAYRDSDGSASQAVRMAMPATRLARTGFEEALKRPGFTGLAESTVRYASALRESMANALKRPIASGAGSPLLITVTGPPHVHRWMWEALRAREPYGASPFPPIVVVHLPDASSEAEWHDQQPAATQAELAWLGARPFAGDLPRYQVLGSVAASVLQSRSGLRFSTVRSDINFAELVAVLRQKPRTAAAVKIVHLDVHGTSNLRVGTGGQLVRAHFSVAVKGDNGAHVVPGEVLASLLGDSMCDLFLTNACFGAQQRGLVEYPFPGKLVQEGRRVAISVREPLQGEAAALLFGAFYQKLASGRSVMEAFAEAATALMDAAVITPADRPVPAMAWDLAARWAVQPVVWARRIADLGLRFEAPDHAGCLAKASREYFSLAALGHELHDFAAAIEDCIWTEQAPLNAIAEAGCELSDASLEGLVDDLSNLFAPTPHIGVLPDTARNAARKVILPALTIEERLRLTVRRFSGPSAIVELLAQVLPGDLEYLDELQLRAKGDACDALLHALSWGTGTIAVAPERSRQVEGYRDVMGDRLTTAFKDDDSLTEGMDAESKSIFAQLMEVKTDLNLALPLVGLGVDTALGAPVPTYTGVGTVSGAELFQLRIGDLLTHDDHSYLSPFPWCQLAARQRVAPDRVALARAFDIRRTEATGIDWERVAWNRGTKLACLSWLALAIGMRQLGAADPSAVEPAWHIISTVSRGAAVDLLRAVQRGLPQWESLEGEDADTYARWISNGERSDQSNDLPLDKRDATDSAIALWRAGRTREVLKLTTSLLSRSATSTPTFHMITVHAYALGREGQVEEALAVIAPLVGQFPTLTRSDQCGLLHLLGELSERQGHNALAVRYFLQERALNHPAVYGRLHNRHHLYTAARASRASDRAMAGQIADEGLALARQARAEEHVHYFAQELLSMALLSGDAGRLDSALETVGDEPELLSLPKVALAKAWRSLMDCQGVERVKVIEALEVLSRRDDEVAGQASLALSEIEGTPVAERVRLLQRGFQHAGSPWFLPCAERLLGALWEQGEYAALEDTATRLLVDVPTSGEAHLALARAGHEAGDENKVIEHLGWACAFSEITAISAAMGSVDLSFIRPAILLRASERSILLLSEHVHQVNNRGVSPEDGVLAGVTLVEALDRVALYNSVQEVDERTVGFMRWVSDCAWDRGDLATAIVARQHLCDLLARKGEPGRPDLAIELGWVASLLKQQGRISEAEILYQQASEMGAGVLAPVDYSSLIGEYGNLLHEMGELEAAVHAQWSAVHGRKPHLNLGEFPPNPALLDEALGLDDIADCDFVLWALLVTNFTNCLKDAGYEALGAMACRYARQAVEAARGVKGGHASDGDLAMTGHLLSLLEEFFGRARH